jgi:DNA-binding transcriptional LysR family regulator
MLDLHKLQIFSLVVIEGSFSAAAEKLHITQSAVSQHMKELEAGLGQQLFERGWRGVSLTAHGRVLADYAMKILDLVAMAENALTNVEGITSGQVRIGATPGIGVYLAPYWVQRFRSRYPHLMAIVQTGVTAQIAADMLDRRVDIGIIEGELDDFQENRLAYLELETVEQRVIVGPNHAFWGAKAIQIAELDQQRIIVRQPNSQSRIWLDHLLRQYQIEPFIVTEFDNIESMKRAVAVGTCLTVLPPYVVQNEIQQQTLHAIPVEDAPFTRSLKLIWHRDQHFSPVTRAFLGELLTTYPALAPALG